MPIKIYFAVMQQGLSDPIDEVATYPEAEAIIRRLVIRSLADEEARQFPTFYIRKLFTATR
jgi:hypothetical protein